MLKPIIIISGPTASGKSALAIKLASHIQGVIINSDSKQVYKEIPIITAQPNDEEKATIPHILYGVVSVLHDFTLSDWLTLATNAINECHLTDKIPILTGGTGMYFKNLIYGVNEMPPITPEIKEHVRNLVNNESAGCLHKLLADKDKDMAAKLNINDKHRVSRALEVFMQTGKSLIYWQQIPPKTFYEPQQFQHFFLCPQRQIVYDNCNKRFDAMLENGVLEEAEKIAAMELSPHLPAFKAHGLPELLSYLKGDITLSSAIELAKLNTRHYIKRQFTWAKSQMPEAIALTSNDPLAEIIKGLVP